MKIHTHWVSEAGEFGELIEKKFFATKSEEETAAKTAKAAGRQVLNRHSWNVGNTAKAVATFCNEQLNIREIDVLKGGANLEEAPQDELGDLF